MQWLHNCRSSHVQVKAATWIKDYFHSVVKNRALCRVRESQLLNCENRVREFVAFFKLKKASKNQWKVCGFDQLLWSHVGWERHTTWRDLLETGAASSAKLPLLVFRLQRFWSSQDRISARFLRWFLAWTIILILNCAMSTKLRR